MKNETIIIKLLEDTSVMETHVYLEGRVQRIIRASCGLFFLCPTFSLFARAVGVVSSMDMCREGSKRQFRVVIFLRIVQSTHVQSWRSAGSASELTCQCYLLFGMVFFL